VEVEVEEVEASVEVLDGQGGLGVLEAREALGERVWGVDVVR
jgi:hypothetical protein